MHTFIAAFMAYLIPVHSAQGQARYEAIAADIVAVAEAEPIDNDPLRTSLLLAAIAYRESQFRHDVETCKVTGDGGKALGLWQTHSSDAVCRNRAEAARVALRMVRRSLDVCQRLSPVDRLGMYTHGRCVRNNWHSRDRFKLVNSWLDAYLPEEM
jgi:hypothetical protein